MDTHQGKVARMSPLGKRIAASLGFAGLLAVAPAAHAVAFSSDLSVSGSVAYDSAYAAGALAGTGTQSGSLRVTQGGASTSSSFSAASVTGSNPLTATLTDFGDGLGFGGSASATAGNLGGTYGLGIDVGLNLVNNSASLAHKITFKIDFGNQVFADGQDAYAHSNFAVFDRANNQTLFFTDLFSDTVNGNLNGGSPVGGFGGQMSETGPASFAVTLLAGQSMFFDPTLHDLAWTLDGGVFSVDPASSGSLDAFIYVAAVDDVTPPAPVPEPATLALLGIGLAAMGTRRRPSRHQD
jgi:hypothetical protein